MKILVINLARSADRRVAMQAQLEKIGVNYSFFPAIDARENRLSDISRYSEAAALNFFGSRLTLGEQGCFASHYLVWKRCIELREPLVVMEDDLEISPNFKAALQRLPSALRHNGFVRLSGTWRRKHDLVERLDSVFSLVRFRKGPMGAQCYAIDPKAAAALIADAAVWIDPVDRYMDRFWTHKIDSYALVPYCVSNANEQEYRSTIEDKRFDKPKGSLWFIRKWRLLCNSFARTICNIRWHLAYKRRI